MTPAPALGIIGNVDTGKLEVFAAALRASRDLVLLVSTDGRVVFANESALARWSDAAGRPARELFPPDVRDSFDAVTRCALETSQSGRFEWGEQRPGGVRSWFSCTVSPVQDEDHTVALLVSSSDVTSLKRSELRLRRSEQLMVDTQGVAHLGTWEWDVNEPHATWSAELYRIYGLSPETYTPSYEAYLTKVHPDDRQRVIDATNRVFHEHEPYSHDERIFRPDGSMRYLHTWALPVLDDNGTLVKLVGV